MSLVERRVCGKRGEEREVRARGVVDRERPLGIPDRDVHLKGARELALGDRSVLADYRLIARDFVELPDPSAERMHPGRRQRDHLPNPLRKRPPPLAQRLGDLGHRC